MLDTTSKTVVEEAVNLCTNINYVPVRLRPKDKEDGDTSKPDDAMDDDNKSLDRTDLGANSLGTIQPRRISFGYGRAAIDSAVNPKQCYSENQWMLDQLVKYSGWHPRGLGSISHEVNCSAGGKKKKKTSSAPR